MGILRKAIFSGGGGWTGGLGPTLWHQKHHVLCCSLGTYLRGTDVDCLVGMRALERDVRSGS